MRVWRTWRAQFGLRSSSQAIKNIHVEKMHPTQQDENETDLIAHEFNRFPRGRHLDTGMQRQHDVTDVNQIEADYQETVHRIGQLPVTMKGIDQKTAAVLMKRPSYPNGRRQADTKVSGIAINDIHFLPRFESNVV
jgi:hypothetical protein